MTFGENLRREREMRGVELREIAEATKISIRFLQALETDRPDILPGGLFPQAFVRQYARHLGLDADKVVADFVYAHKGVVADRPTATIPPPAAPDSGPGTAMVARVAGLAAVVVVALGIFAWRSRGSGEAPAVEVPVESPALVVQPSDRVYPPPSAAAAATLAHTDGLVLALQPRQSCWVKLQVDRVTVLNRTLAQGETLTFEAKEELVLNVGNAGGLAYTLNGRPGVALGKDGEVRTNIVITRDSARGFLDGGAATRPTARPPAPTAAPVAPPAPTEDSVDPTPGRR